MILKLEEEAGEVLKDKFFRFHTLITNIMSSVSRGFLIERQISVHFNSLAEILNDWEQKYLERNRFLNAVYDYAPLAGYWIASGNDTIFDEYDQYFLVNHRFSEIGQVVNDLADWTPVFNENERSYQDRFADIRNGLITFPVQYFIDQTCIKDALINPEITLDKAWQAEIMFAISHSNLLKEVKARGKQCLHSQVEFWEMHRRTTSQLVFQQYLTLIMNKYFAALQTNNA